MKTFFARRLWITGLVAVGLSVLWINRTRLPLLHMGVGFPLEENSSETDHESIPGGVSEPVHLLLSGEQIPPSELRDATARVYLFLSTDCPISNGYLPELHRLNKRFTGLNIAFYGVITGAPVSRETARNHQREYKITFPVLWDPRAEFQKWLEATHTPQAVVVNADGEVFYSGRIDDLYADLGQKQLQPTQRELQTALDAIVSGQPIAKSRTEPVGCPIETDFTDLLLQRGNTSLSQPPVTWSKEIAPLIYRHCSRCHRPGEVAPFSLLSYEEITAHARQIENVITSRRMPPWKAEPGYGEFANEHRLADGELEILLGWLRGGMPPGNLEEQPKPPTFPAGWALGEPDLILEMPDKFSIPADGPDIYQHFVIPSGLATHRLVSAMEFRPGNPRVVHHAMVYLDTSGKGRELDAADPGPGYERLGTPGFITTGSLGGWGPGGTPQKLPPGLGRVMPKNADVVLQVHYHPSGKPEQDRSRIGLYFAEEKATHPVGEIIVANVDLQIPPGALRHYHRASYTLPVRTLFFDATPHMHVLGCEIKATAWLPDRSRVPLVWIREWDFYWQEDYVFKTPLWLPKGTEIVLECWYDNSADNPLNPHSPPQTVTWGDHSDDEMGNIYFQVTTATAAEYQTLMEHAGRYFQALWNRAQEQKP